MSQIQQQQTVDETTGNQFGRAGAGLSANPLESGPAGMGGGWTGPPDRRQLGMQQRPPMVQRPGEGPIQGPAGDPFGTFGGVGPGWMPQHQQQQQPPQHFFGFQAGPPQAFGPGGPGGFW